MVAEVQRYCSHAFGDIKGWQQLQSLQRALCCTVQQHHLLSGPKSAHPGRTQSPCISPPLRLFRCWRSSRRIQQPGTIWGTPQQVGPAELSSPLGALPERPAVYGTALRRPLDTFNLTSCGCRAGKLEGGSGILWQSRLTGARVCICRWSAKTTCWTSLADVGMCSGKACSLH